MRAPVVLLDLDGTLTDPWDGITRSVAAAVEGLGLPPLPDARLRAFLGPPLHDAFAGLGLDPAGVRRAVTLYRERFSTVGLYENRVYDGVPEALARLSAAGVRLAVATSKPTPFAERIVEHFGLRGLEHVGGATLDGSRSRKADVIAHVLGALGVPASDAVMVGDRAQDVAGAGAHGIDCVGVRWGYAEPGELEDAGASALVDTPEELATLLLGRRRG